MEGIVSRGDREAVALVGHDQLGVAAIQIVAGEACPLAQVLAAGAAKPAHAAGLPEPGNADHGAGREPGGALASAQHGADDLVSEYQRQLGV